MTPRDDSATVGGALRELVVCSLEPWDEVWRRNQFFVDALLKRNPVLRVLFVEPPTDVLFDLSQRRRPQAPVLRRVTPDGRLRALRPLKPLPRRFGGLSDAALLPQVLLAARALHFARPTLWVNDVTYAPLIERTGWPSLYDVTDDWLLAPFPKNELDRLRRLDRLALDLADEVVVCSPALARTRGEQRPVSLIPNGVDVQHFRRTLPRPSDLPRSPVAVYVGSLHEARLDVDLVAELARSLPDLNVALVGPNSLEAASQRLLSSLPNVVALGSRAYRDVPAYLQHADVVIIPHKVSDFTESLDPIKAYECLAISTPTVATPVAGFRDLATAFHVVDRDAFSARVGEVISGFEAEKEKTDPVGWEVRARAFENRLLAAGNRATREEPRR